MRIRKRQVPFPLSSLSPVPLSDLDLCRSPECPLADDGAADHPKNVGRSPEVHLGTAPVHPHPSNQPNRGTPDPTSTTSRQGNDASEEHNKNEKRHRSELRVEDKKQVEYEVPETHDFRKESNLGAVAPPGNFSSSISLSGQAKETWWCGEGGYNKAVPLKKRRGSYNRGALKANTSSVKQPKIVTQESLHNVNNNMMQTKIFSQESLNDDGGSHDSKGGNGAKKEGRRECGGSKSDRKRRGGAVATEGSRCSRVNGRGWRCCQKTIAGYSLCEHHLGKSRLRSVSTARSRASAGSSIQTSASKTTPVEEKNMYVADDDNHRMLDILHDDVSNKEDDHNDDDDDDGNEHVKNRRMRIGTVKARSLSSLLGDNIAANNK